MSAMPGEIMKRFSFLLVLVLLIQSWGIGKAHAEPWINASDQYLRGCLQQLAQSGALSIPVNTYPLMWKSVSSQIDRLAYEDLGESNQAAFQCLKNALRYAKSDKAGIRISATTRARQFNSLGEVWRERAAINLYKSFTGDTWAAKVSANLRDDPSGGQNRNYDGSYVARVFGNWVVSVDQVSQWWGPGQDSSLALSNNATAFPALRLSRHSSEAASYPWLSWLGPWSLTTYLGQQEHGTSMPGTNVWGMRINLRPLNSLELGLSRTSQWGGGDRQESLSTLWDLFTGNVADIDSDDSDGMNSRKEPANQIDAVDLKWYLEPVLEVPFNVYVEMARKAGEASFSSGAVQLIGAEFSWHSEEYWQMVYVEVSDTTALCGDSSDMSSCIYQSGLYPEGYRRYGYSMGSTYDVDTQAAVIGYQYWSGGWQAFAKLRILEIGTVAVLGDQPPAVARDERQLQFGIRYPLFNGKLNAQLTLRDTESDTLTANLDDSDAVLSLSWEMHY